MKEEYLFVYGTLRRDTGNNMYHLLARYATFVGEATYQGLLFKIDYYPGVVPSDDPTHHVRGEVYRLLDSGLVLSQLDRYEECGPGFPEPTEYVRKKQEVSLCNGEKLVAWVYIYNRSTEKFPLIPSGDFLNTDTELKTSASRRK